jgi:nucleoside-diphosphate-sugar epimerase
LKVLVAGATGAIGRALIPKLLGAGHEVVALTRSPEKAAALGVHVAPADAFDAEAVRAAVAEARPDAVIDELTDLGGGSPLDPRSFAANDRMRLEGCANVLAAARAAGVTRYLQQSIAFFAQPGEGSADEDVPLAVDSPVGEGVRAVAMLEARVREAGGTILRYGNFYGPGTWYVPDGAIADAVRARKYPVVGNGGAAGSFVHVEDAADATVAALERGATGTFHVVADETPPAREWLPAYAAALGAKRPRRVPAFIARRVAGPGAVWYATRLRAADNAKARRELGFAPRPFVTPAELYPA